MDRWNAQDRKDGNLSATLTWKSRLGAIRVGWFKDFNLNYHGNPQKNLMNPPDVVTSCRLKRMSEQLATTQVSNEQILGVWVVQGGPRADRYKRTTLINGRK